MFGVTINGKHTFRDYGLRMKSYTLPMPEAKVSKIEIPYSDGALDQTEITGQVFYKDRDGVVFEFVQYDGNFKKYQEAVHRLAQELHGKKVEVIFDNDPEYYYLMRLSISASKSKMPLSNITITGSADPYKYGMYMLGENWKWDPFSFVDGVIVRLNDIDVDGEKVIPIGSDSAPTTPTFIVRESNGLRLEWEGDVYEMPTRGSYYFPQVKITEDTTSLVLKGSGQLNIECRGLYL